jgi:tetratricopeptide (TPR) repeat protein
MTSSVVRAITVLALLAAGAPAMAGPREDALAGLAKRGDVEARRQAALTLAEAGTMADVPTLLGALRDADERVRALAERALWEVWSRSGNEDVDHLLRAGVIEMQHGQLEASIDTFSEVIRRRPDFAEGWNKRATVYYLVGEYRKSAADCDEVLKRNPSHFGALSGYGMIWLRLDEPARALERFEQALAVNPNLDSVRETVEALRALLIQQRRNAI